MLGYAKLLNEGVVDLKDTSLTRTGNLVRVRNKLGDVVNEYVFDLDMGSSLLEFVSAGSDPSLIWKCKMEKVGGAFVPGVLTRNEVRANERLFQEMRWFDQIVNEPVSEQDFTIAKLGVHRTDRVQDNRTGASYELTDDKVPPRTTPGIARQLRQTSQGFPYTFVGNLVLIIAAAAFFIYRRFRKR